MSSHRRTNRSVLLGATALVGALAMAASPAAAQDQQRYEFDLPAQPLSSALRAFGATADQQLIFADADIKGRGAPAIKGNYTADDALRMLLAGSDLQVRRTTSGVVQIAATQAPQGGSAAGGGATVEALIVTAQKREEDIQDVPIAISAFSQEDLTRSQVAGGPDLMTQVPNMTFTKTNFSSYSIQIRGIGTQAISATTDPAVAVAFNNTPFVRNRFFEQEFYDLQRVEVLRGPQGTLYGRNATAGVVNIISAKPKFFYEAKLAADIANYNSTRIEGMVNIPLVEDAVALRLAGAWTKRDGFVTNEITGSPIDGRDLWSSRLSLRFTPNDRADVNLIWEHFEEDDDRLRSGKQLCNKDVVTSLAGAPIQVEGGGWSGPQAFLSQGCKPVSLYAPEAFESPNGWALPYYHPLGAIFLPTNTNLDPYVSTTQSRDLRVIESTVNPEYKAKSDIVELQVSIDLSDSLTLQSETAYATDFIFSTQDFNRFNTASGAWRSTATGGGPNEYIQRGILNINEAGFAEFCDPQIGCADRLVAVDLSTARSRHFSQELRLASNFDGPFNFSIGGNFLRYDTVEKYYVFINSLSLIASLGYSDGIETYPYASNQTDNHQCLQDLFNAGPRPPNPFGFEGIEGCIYIDPNPIGSLNDLGHNYFLSTNPYKLLSYAAFGEAYYNLADNLKVTAGLRWTVDRKEAPRIPSWVLGINTVGYPVAEVIEQEWREPTGRLTIDWKPDLSFTDETLVYASYAHGYKAGGANPPAAGLTGRGAAGATAEGTGSASGDLRRSITKPKTFDAEFIDAFELGLKNTMFDGKLTLNLAAFYYDYEGYQISYIVDRSAVNLNFDAEVMGLEIEADWRPLENLRFGFKGGYEDTKVADGERAIDVMDRSDGHRVDYLEDGTEFFWVVFRPFPSRTQNCVLPSYVLVYTEANESSPSYHTPGEPSGGGDSGCEIAYSRGLDPLTGEEYEPDPPLSFRTYPGYPGFDPTTAPNGGEGFYQDLSGNELPNAPHFTATITVDYTVPLAGDWLVNLHTDLYWQSEAWTRIFNTEGYDKLKAYTNVNLAAIFTNEHAGWNIMAYVKNVMDRDSITGAFLISDDTGLPTNVFLTEPRLYGLRVTKEWTGGPLLGSFGARHDGPYPLTLELGGQVQRHDAPNERFRPSFETAFPTEVLTLSDQDNDLDWGDGREVKLTYQTQNGWRASAGVRYGETNSGQRNIRFADEGVRACTLYPNSPSRCEADERLFMYRSASSNGYTVEREEHTIADFVVGRDFGLGGLTSSKMSGGLRYAQFGSTTNIDLYGRTNWRFAKVGAGPTAKYHVYHDQYDADFSADREFKGTGPVLSWEASKGFLGDADVGTFGLDWSVTGGVLFGKQEARISGEEVSAYFDQRVVVTEANPITPVDDPMHTPLDIAPRSKSVTVPTLGASLGLSYSVDRFNIGAGYRWERYYDVIDGGVGEADKQDRTIDGPYFKLSVGFGG